MTSVLKKYSASLGDSSRSRLVRQNTFDTFRFRPKDILHVVHRLGNVAFAILYVVMSFSAAYSAMLLLRGYNNPWSNTENESLPLVVGHLGAGAIRDSPLITDFLSNSTAPINASIYLHTEAHVSLNECEGWGGPHAAVFSDSFMRTLYKEIGNGVSYNITMVDPAVVELIAPVVDCQAEESDSTSAKFLFLVRQVGDIDAVSVLVVYLSNQQYRVVAQNQRGPVAFASLQLVSDMRATNVDTSARYIASLGYPFTKFRFRALLPLGVNDEGLANMAVVPPPNTTQIPMTIQTACREGFYIKGESEQSNLYSFQWYIEPRAVDAVSRWRWYSKPVWKDSWAWVHAVQFFIGLDLLSHLTVLCLASYRSLRMGKKWVGDAFVSISSWSLLHSLAVLASWRVNEFWVVHEYSLILGYKLAGWTSTGHFLAPIRADLLTIYLGLCSIIGRALKEKIDPFVAMSCFFVGFNLRVEILEHIATPVRATIIEYANAAYEFNVSPRVEGQDAISPMGFWTTHHLKQRSLLYSLRCVLPVLMSLALVLVYVVARKIYHFFYPPRVHVLLRTNGTAVSEDERSLLAQRRVLTVFEVATGSQLEDRYGLVCDFEASIFIRGTKHASPDGIYSTGFIIANNKYLLQTSDYWGIVLMKVLGRRYRNIYVYDVKDSTVEQTARLVYPHTLSVADLLSINVSILS